MLLTAHAGILRRLPPRHRNVRRIREALVEVYEREGRPVEAAKYRAD